MGPVYLVESRANPIQQPDDHEYPNCQCECHPSRKYAGTFEGDRGIVDRKVAGISALQKGLTQQDDIFLD
jgi:hypothetical protein